MAKPDLWACTKFKRLCRALNLPRPYIVGLLETLWQAGYATANSFVGSSEDVECAAEWPGNPGVLTAALVDARFIDHDDSGYYIHDLADHAPDYVRKRIDRRKNKDLETKAADNGGQRRTTADFGGRASENGALPTHTYLPNTPNTPIVGDKSPKLATPSGLPEVVIEGARIMLSPESCEAFFDYYTSNGWKVGRNPMKDWRAAMRKWKRTSYETPTQRAPLNSSAFANLPPEVK